MMNLIHVFRQNKTKRKLSHVTGEIRCDIRQTLDDAPQDFLQVAT